MPGKVNSYILYSQGLQTFSAKGQIGHILGL